MSHPLENPRVGIGIDISPMPVRHGQTPARRLRVAGKRMLWRAGRGIVVRDLPWMVEKLRAGIFQTFNHKTKDFSSGGKEHPSRAGTRGGAR